VRFLDWADRRIRRIIRARRRRIRLLEEYKQALINQAVTGKIDVRTGKPYPKYKHSGVEWLGEVPEHWEVRRLRQVALMLVSNVDKHTKEGEIAVHLCNYLDVYKNERITADIKFMRATASPDEIKRFRLRCGDVAITKDSEIWNDIGVPALVEYEAPDLVYGYHLAILRPYRNQLVGLYLLRALQSQGVATQLHVAANGVTRFGLSHNAIKNAQIPVPPLHEQTAIVEFLDEQTARIDAAIAADRRIIDLLKEFRTRLIADVVTGKLDVREVAAKLPDELPEEEAEPLDEEDRAAGGEADLEAISEEAEI
jgi:type I restriction enzyme S subunit